MVAEGIRNKLSNSVGKQVIICVTIKCENEKKKNALRFIFTTKRKARKSQTS